MQVDLTLQFLGGAGTVTGSKYWIRSGGKQVLLDCGVFQGKKSLRQRNWRSPPFNASRIDAVVLSHAHVDHSGYLPVLVRRGFKGPVYCTRGTKSLLEILLPDAAHIQEEEASYANRKGFTKHHPAEPLFTSRDATSALRLLKTCDYGSPLAITDGIQSILRRAGHILGSATVELQFQKCDHVLVFSGDLGRWNRPMLRDPDFVPYADTLLVESTYGDRLHSDSDTTETLTRVVNESAERGGALLIPAFAVGRTQEILWRLRELEDAGKIPRLPVFLDSPMAIDATNIFCRHPEDHDIDMKLLMDARRCPLCCKSCTLTRKPDESKALNELNEPVIIIASSGMATAGRIVHHLKHRLSDKRTTVLLVGFQAAGTRGRSLQNGAQSLRMHGQDVPVRATIETLGGLSAHADRHEILRWLAGFIESPRQTFIVHGEPDAAEELQESIKEQLHWNVQIAKDLQRASLLGSECTAKGSP